MVDKTGEEKKNDLQAGRTTRRRGRGWVWVGGFWCFLRASPTGWPEEINWKVSQQEGGERENKTKKLKREIKEGEQTVRNHLVASIVKWDERKSPAEERDLLCVALSIQEKNNLERPDTILGF